MVRLTSARMHVCSDLALLSPSFRPLLSSLLFLSSRHLERARIIYAIEHELGEEERGERNNKYWTVLGGKRYLQVMVENPKHFRKNEAEEEAEKDKE